jgi:hypothetical protein
MRQVIFSIFAVMLCACSKEVQDYSKITLVINGKTTLNEKAEGSNLPKFNSKHAPLIDAILASCENRESVANLRQLMEDEHKMNISAEIELKNEESHGSSDKSLLKTTRSWKVEINKGKFSCAESIAN